MKWKLGLYRGFGRDEGFPENSGYHVGDPYHKDYNIRGSMLGSRYLRKIPDEALALSFHRSL